MPYYSKLLNGFPDPSIITLPEDAVEISTELHNFLLLEIGKGKKLVSDSEGNPIVVDNEPSLEDWERVVVSKRNELLTSVDWLVLRHRDQVESSVETTLSTEKYKELLSYRQSLRDLTNQEGFPLNVVWPEFSLD